MLKENTLKQNIEFLLNLYKKVLDIENKKDILKQDLKAITFYENIIVELEYALKISIGD